MHLIMICYSCLVAEFGFFLLLIHIGKTPVVNIESRPIPCISFLHEIDDSIHTYAKYIILNEHQILHQHSRGDELNLLVALKLGINPIIHYS